MNDWSLTDLFYVISYDCILDFERSSSMISLTNGPSASKIRYIRARRPSLEKKQMLNNISMLFEYKIWQLRASFKIHDMDLLLHIYDNINSFTINIYFV